MVVNSGFLVPLQLTDHAVRVILPREIKREVHFIKYFCCFLGSFTARESLPTHGKLFLLRPLLHTNSVLYVYTGLGISRINI